MIELCRLFFRISKITSVWISHCNIFPCLFFASTMVLYIYIAHSRYNLVTITYIYASIYIWCNFYKEASTQDTRNASFCGWHYSKRSNFQNCWRPMSIITSYSHATCLNHIWSIHNWWKRSRDRETVEGRLIARHPSQQRPSQGCQFRGQLFCCSRSGYSRASSHRCGGCSRRKTPVKGGGTSLLS